MPLISGNVLLLLFLYFIQGLPYGLQAQFLPIYLRSKGVDLTSIGLLRVLYAPWLCKFLWAPFVDRSSTKRKWLLGSIFGLGLTCLGGAVFPPEQLVTVAIVLFLLNLFTSIQDVAVDAVAIALLATDELGQGNTAQVVGYKLGSIFAGGILASFIDVTGWLGLFVVLSLLYIEAGMFVFVSPSLRNLETVSFHSHFPAPSPAVKSVDGSLYGDKEQCPISDFRIAGNDDCDVDIDLHKNIDTTSLRCSNAEISEDNQLSKMGTSQVINCVPASQFTTDTISRSDITCNRTHGVADNKNVNNMNNAGAGDATVENVTFSTKVLNVSKVCESFFDDDDVDYVDVGNNGHEPVTAIEEEEEEAEVESTDTRNIFRKVIGVPGTKWMAIFLLIFKLGLLFS